MKKNVVSANGMRLVDTIVCVECGVLTYREAEGKNGRRLEGICGICFPKVFLKGENDASSSDGKKAQSSFVSQGSSGKAS